MRHYHLFTPAGIADQAQGLKVITEAEVCGSGATMRIDTAIGDFISTGHSGHETWNELLAIGLSTQEVLSGFERLGHQA